MTPEIEAPSTGPESMDPLFQAVTAEARAQLRRTGRWYALAAGGALTVVASFVGLFAGGGWAALGVGAVGIGAGLLGVIGGGRLDAKHPGMPAQWLDAVTASPVASANGMAYLAEARHREGRISLYDAQVWMLRERQHLKDLVCAQQEGQDGL